MPPDQVFAARLRSMRTLRGFSQHDIERLSGLKQGQYSRYETSAILPETSTLVRLAEVLCVSTDYLLGRTAEPTTTHTVEGRGVLLGKLCERMSEEDYGVLLWLARRLAAPYAQG